jgi:ectoine hydroxylase-related dioxygenase (phytanoyl-CoA dioxygenase family)
MKVLQKSPADKVELTAEQIRLYAESGYLSVNAITTEAEILEIKTSIEKLFVEKRGENEGAYGELVAGAGKDEEENSPQIVNLVNYAPQLHQTTCFRNALHIAKQILGDKARFFLDLSIMKQAKTGVGTPWHQDAAFRDPRFEYKELGIWVPLQEATAEAGCLHFIPGSHKNAVLEHHPANDDPTSQALRCTAPFDEVASVACPLPVGGCSIHHPLTLHCAHANTSDVPRYAYIMVFGVSPKPASEPRVFPWLEQRAPTTQARKRKWMRRGGVLVTAWRRLRRADLTSWSSAAYWVRRSIQTFRKGA